MRPHGRMLQQKKTEINLVCGTGRESRINKQPSGDHTMKKRRRLKMRKEKKKEKKRQHYVGDSKKSSRPVKSPKRVHRLCLCMCVPADPAHAHALDPCIKRLTPKWFAPKYTRKDISTHNKSVCLRGKWGCVLHETRNVFAGEGGVLLLQVLYIIYQTRKYKLGAQWEEQTGGPGDAWDKRKLVKIIVWNFEQALHVIYLVETSDPPVLETLELVVHAVGYNSFNETYCSRYNLPSLY